MKDEGKNTDTKSIDEAKKKDEKKGSKDPNRRKTLTDGIDIQSLQKQVR